MERRVLLAIFLCFLSLYLWQAVMVKPVPKPPVPATGAPATGAPAAGVPAAPGSTAPATAATKPAAIDSKLAPLAEAPLVGDASEREIRVETRDVIALFTNRGARLKSWRLKHYLDHQMQPQELVVNDLQSQPLPFTLRVPDDATNTVLSGGLYAVSGAPADQPPATTPTHLRFEYSTAGNSLHVVKEFEIPADGYILSVKTTLTGAAGDDLPYAIHWGAAVGDIVENSRYAKKAEGLLFQDKVRRLASKDFAAQPIHEGDFKYAGVDDNYFMTAALAPGPAKVTFQAIVIPPPPGSKEAERDLVAYAIEPSRRDAPIRFFAGPKDFDVLAAIDRDVVRAIDFGMFSILVVPLLRSLKWVHGFVGNYGWSIIILTIMINAIMFPLRHKSVVSMRKMQEIQPEVKAIQERYSKLKATDPAKQKMNTEMMALYRERGVNPASGCVPMLLTMPVLIAFYALLSTAIELRGAPFFGWIHDLSVHDPLYIMPVLMGITMVWQQKLAPAAGADPAQQKMMMFMPVVFTGMFLWAPAGVAVYWFMSNLWAIGQQYLTNYLIGPPNIRNSRPPAERQMKRVGASKTEAAARES
ncbi:MAG: membrane protein insertase YidC [Acidobacteriota bacterium]